MAQIAFPFRPDPYGRTALSDADAHVRELVGMVLFTHPGERVNRPTFGSNLARLNFEPGGDELAVATQFLVQGALQQWLGDVVLVEQVQVEPDEAALRVTVHYQVRRTQQRRAVVVAREA